MNDGRRRKRWTVTVADREGKRSLSFRKAEDAKRFARMCGRVYPKAKVRLRNHH